jgi:hypothetical protein
MSSCGGLIRRGWITTIHCRAIGQSSREAIGVVQPSLVSPRQHQYYASSETPWVYQNADEELIQRRLICPYDFSRDRFARAL